jgi:hypothetical protein
MEAGRRKISALLFLILLLLGMGISLVGYAFFGSDNGVQSYPGQGGSSTTGCCGNKGPG